MVAGQWASKLLQGIFGARHLEPQHRRGGDRHPRRRKLLRHAPLGSLGQPHRDGQSKASPDMPAGDPLIVLGACRHDRLNDAGIHGQRPRLDRHTDRLPGRADHQPLPCEPAMAVGGFEQPLERVGIDR